MDVSFNPVFVGYFFLVSLSTSISNEVDMTVYNDVIHPKW